MTIKECFEPLQFVTTFQDARQFFIDLLHFATANRIDYITSMLSEAQQAKLYFELYVSLNQNEEVKELLTSFFFI